MTDSARKKHDDGFGTLRVHKRVKARIQAIQDGCGRDENGKRLTQSAIVSAGLASAYPEKNQEKGYQSSIDLVLGMVLDKGIADWAQQLLEIIDRAPPGTLSALKAIANAAPARPVPEEGTFADQRAKMEPVLESVKRIIGSPRSATKRRERMEGGKGRIDEAAG